MKSLRSMQDLENLLLRFLAKENTSLCAAKRIEQTINTEFTDNQVLLNLSDCLSHVRPGMYDQNFDYEDVKYQMLDCVKEIWDAKKVYLD
ncbi:MAG: hypothetical protein H6622_05675 [Halobacteriovoraceae bacterium]|nr:hypothetical protein [Halobacteriovoraceae bacterium]